MDDNLAPGWIRERKRNADLRAAQEALEEQRFVNASLMINSQSPDIWKSLLKEIQLNLVPLKDIPLRGDSRLVGNLISISRKDSKEQTYRIIVSLESIIPKATYTDIFYSPENSGVIRCITQEGKAFDLLLCLNRNRTGVILESREFPGEMDAEQVAAFLVKRMADMIAPE